MRPNLHESVHRYMWDTYINEERVIAPVYYVDYVTNSWQEILAVDPGGNLHYTVTYAVHYPIEHRGKYLSKYVNHSTQTTELKVKKLPDQWCIYWIGNKTVFTFMLN